MPSAFHDPARDRWIADFRPLKAAGLARRRTVVPASRLRPGHELADAAAFARECDQACRLLDVRVSAAALHRARELGAISRAQATALLSGGPLPVGKAHHEGSLVAAALAHPASRRDGERDATNALVYLRHIEAFAAWSGCTTVRGLTLDLALGWVRHLREQGVSQGGRRHRLRYLRRAAVMAASWGLPNPLSGLRLDERADDPAPMDVLALDELARVLVMLEDPRARLAAALGGCLGLRPSETARLLVGDLAGSTLRVGERVAKNRASRRTVPMPATVAAWCTAAAAGRPARAPLIPSRAPGRAEACMAASAWCQWLQPLLTAAAGRHVPAKGLRKAFATWASSCIAGRDVERFLGHQSGLLATVTSRHYLGAALARELEPAAAVLERELAAALERAAVYRSRPPGRKALQRKA